MNMKSKLWSLPILLLIFISLYPKLPLWNIVPNYVVHLRLDDLVVAGYICLGLGYYRWRQSQADTSISFPRSIHWFGWYWLIGLVSLIFALIQASIYPEWNHLWRSLLHWGRYGQYGGVLLASYIFWRYRPKQIDLDKVVWGLSLILVLTGIYGWGQINLGWPAYSTMTLEYSRGIPVYVSSSAVRIPSTFAGHYDYAGFLALTLPLVSSFFLVNKFKNKFQLGLIVFAISWGIWGLTVSALRSAVLGYGIGLIVLAGGLFWRFRFKLKYKALLFVGLNLVIFIGFGQNFRQLAYQALQNVPVISSLVPDSAGIIDQYTPVLPKDEFDQANQDTQVYTSEQTPTYSECVSERGLSWCIRQEVLWPNAINGWLTNPLTGQGFATLNKAAPTDLPVADGTDNNYLRILGETGILGLLTFTGFLLSLLYQLLKNYQGKNNSLPGNLSLGLMAGILAIGINGLLIDVFVASKIAYPFYALAGIFLAHSQNKTY